MSKNNQYEGLKVTLVDTYGNKVVVTKPLSKTAVEKQLRENKGEYSSFVTDFIRGREGSYEKYDDKVVVTLRQWTPGSSSISQSDIKDMIRKDVKNVTTARKEIMDFILS